MRYTAEAEKIHDIPLKFTFNPKLGIDNPALVISDDTEPDVSLQLCRLTREQGQGFGFHLQRRGDVQGHSVDRVEPWSAAEQGGLREGHHVLEVNGEYVHHKKHAQVVRQIQESGLQIFLIVLHSEDYERAMSKKLDFRSLVSAHHGGICAQPRLCHITKEPDFDLGLTIMPIEGMKNSYRVSVVSEGPAERAGVCNGDRLVWINGTMVSTLTHSALTKTVKKCGDHLTVLVIDSQSQLHYIRRNIPILPSMAGYHNLPHRPKTLRLTQGPHGYGFLLRQEKLQTGRIAHMLREVDPCSPAEQVGMEDGDLLLSVNGEPIEMAEHEDIVSKVRQSGQQVTLTCISLNGREFYEKLALSPLLFYEEDILERLEENRQNPMRGSPLKSDHLVPLCPRLCIVNKEASGFGFSLGCVQNEPGTFISQVTAGSGAERSGLCEDDVVVEVNGQSVEKEYLKEVVRLIMCGGSSVKMVVMDRHGYKTQRQSGLPYTAVVPCNNRVSESAPNTFV
ncbi:Na(+)/H(+) exchange regulatory cofactor NHE-RF3 [Clupea harengus]|uniref:Na(+)/H(+) exchange regulatory cofactor NHE-RF3 n=1 Tax=Clupea harengus TaxID=7950 RepID=A0A6P8GWL8_CLUHA|nr:Na(+)/H(+) exchange regulatory cofactor NHE-RF3 [Clupea harengus]